MLKGEDPKRETSRLMPLVINTVSTAKANIRRNIVFIVSSIVVESGVTQESNSPYESKPTPNLKKIITRWSDQFNHRCPQLQPKAVKISKNMEWFHTEFYGEADITNVVNYHNQWGEY